MSDLNVISAKQFKTCPISGILCNCLKDCTKDDPRIKTAACIGCGNHHGSVNEENACKEKEIQRLRDYIVSLESEIRPLREMKAMRDKNIEDFNNIPRTTNGWAARLKNPKKEIG